MKRHLSRGVLATMLAVVFAGCTGGAPASAPSGPGDPTLDADVPAFVGTYDVTPGGSFALMWVNATAGASANASRPGVGIHVEPHLGNGSYVRAFAFGYVDGEYVLRSAAGGVGSSGFGVSPGGDRALYVLVFHAEEAGTVAVGPFRSPGSETKTPLPLQGRSWPAAGAAEVSVFTRSAKGEYEHHVNATSTGLDGEAAPADGGRLELATRHHAGPALAISMATVIGGVGASAVSAAWHEGDRSHERTLPAASARIPVATGYQLVGTTSGPDAMQVAITGAAAEGFILFEHHTLPFVPEAWGLRFREQLFETTGPL